MRGGSLEGFELNGPGTVSVDQFMGEEDRRKYAIAQRAQVQRTTRPGTGLSKESPDVELIDLSSDP
jgi:chitin synthase